jgi:hypothetical protein
MEPQKNIMIFTQPWHQGTVANVGIGGFIPGPGNPGNVMIYAAKIGHIDPVQVFFPGSESCCERTPGRLTFGHVVGEQDPQGLLWRREGLKNVWIYLKTNFSFNQKVFFRILFCFCSLMWALFLCVYCTIL